MCGIHTTSGAGVALGTQPFQEAAPSRAANPKQSFPLVCRLGLESSDYGPKSRDLTEVHTCLQAQFQSTRK